MQGSVVFEDGFEGVGGGERHLFADAVAGGVDRLGANRQTLRYLLGTHADSDVGAETQLRTASGGVTASKSHQYGGLFSYIGEHGTVKNVTVADDCVYDVYNMSGSIAGINYGTIENCRNHAPIGGNGMATGGIVGENDGTVSGCYNGGDVTIQQNAVKTGAGGIAGANTGLIDLCQNDGDIKIADGKTSEVFGGIAAINYGTIDRSLNLGEVKANVKAGGIAATLGAYGVTGKISRSANFATVTTVKDNTNGAVANDIRDNNVTDVIYDSSITAIGASLNPLPGCSGLSTAELVSGEAPAGIPAEILDLKAGKYPVLKTFAAEPRAEILRSTYIDFAAGQSVANLGSDVSISSAAGVAWSLTESESFAIEGNTIKVTIPEGDMSAKSTATAAKGEEVVKTFMLTSLPVLFEGLGSEESPYLIKTKEDINTLSDFVTKNAYDCLNMHYQLVNDITYAESDEFAPVGGDGTTKFNGVFDDNGKSVSGIVYSSTVAKPGKNTGLFGQVGPRGVIHDLTVDNTLTGYGAGGVAARLEGEIYNCVNKGTIVATGDPAGGIAGTLKSGATVRDCSNFGSVMSEKTYGTGGIVGKAEDGSAITACVNKGALGGEKQGKVLGGIAGIAAGQITDCHNEGVLSSASASIGGIAGKHLSGKLLEIDNCHNKAAVNAPKATGVGGILGGNDSDKALNKAHVHISNCDNTAPIVATLGVGGILGIVSESDFTVENCFNTGSIEAMNLGAKNFSDTFAGGIAGCANGSTIEGTDQYIRNCHNTGKVTAWGGNNIGGIIGKHGVLLQNCYNTGDVQALFDAEGLTDLTGFQHSDIGGIAGCSYAVIENSWNSGNVVTDGCWIGGITGYTNKDVVGCANLGDITGQAGAIAGGTDTQGVGGIVGRMGTISYAGFITDCYNTGAITGLTQVAGIVAQRFGNEVQLENVYNTGAVKASAEGGTAYAIGNQRTEGAETLPANAHVYYLEGCCVPLSALDNAAKAVTAETLSTAQLGEGYILSPGALPVLADLYTPAYTYLQAIYGLVFENAENTYESVTSDIFFANLPGLVWTASDNIEMGDERAIPRVKGEGWMRVALADDDTLFKQYDLTVASPSGVDGISDGMDGVVSVEYYDLQGIRVAAPTAGSVCIERAVLNGGTIRVRRILAD